MNIIVSLLTTIDFVELSSVYAYLQLISKCPLGVIVWTKIPTKSLKTFRLYFGPNDDTKRTF